MICWKIGFYSELSGKTDQLSSRVLYSFRECVMSGLLHPFPLACAVGYAAEAACFRSESCTDESMTAPCQNRSRAPNQRQRQTRLNNPQVAFFKSIFVMTRHLKR